MTFAPFDSAHKAPDRCRMIGQTGPRSPQEDTPDLRQARRERIRRIGASAARGRGRFFA